MSGSKDKQRRKGQREQGVDMRNPQEIEAERAQQRRTRTAVVTLIVFAVVGVILLVVNSNMFYRHMTALNVDGEKFSITDMNYYFNQAYQYHYYYEYGMYYLDTSTSLKNQTYDEDRTYYDYIYEQAVENAQRSAMLYRYAVEEDMEISEEYLEQIEESIQYIEDNYEEYYTTANNYVVAQYGKGMNMTLLRERMEYDYLGQMYADKIIEEFEDSYTDDILEEYYVENSEDFDYIEYRLYTAYYDDEDAETEDDDEEEAEDPVTAEDAKAEADAIADAADSEEAFVEAVKATLDEDTLESYDDDTTLNSNLGSTLESYEYEYTEWLLDEDRDEGDVTVVEGEGAYYVLYYIGRDGNEYYRTSVRHILLAPEEVDTYDEDGEELDEDTIAELEEEALAEALERAEAVLAEWEDGELTEERFVELIWEYTDDSLPEADEGEELDEDEEFEAGLYEEINRHSSYVDGFLDWAVDQDHEVGDVEIVESEYGYHIMYFVEYEEDTYRKVLAENAKLSEDYQDWLDEILEDFDYSESILARLVA